MSNRDLVIRKRDLEQLREQQIYLDEIMSRVAEFIPTYYDHIYNPISKEVKVSLDAPGDYAEVTSHIEEMEFCVPLVGSRPEYTIYIKNNNLHVTKHYFDHEGDEIEQFDYTDEFKALIPKSIFQNLLKQVEICDGLSDLIYKY